MRANSPLICAAGQLALGLCEWWLQIAPATRTAASQPPTSSHCGSALHAPSTPGAYACTPVKNYASPASGRAVGIP